MKPDSLLQTLRSENKKTKQTTTTRTKLRPAGCDNGPLIAAPSTQEADAGGSGFQPAKGYPGRLCFKGVKGLENKGFMLYPLLDEAPETFHFIQMPPTVLHVHWGAWLVIWVLGFKLQSS